MEQTEDTSQNEISIRKPEFIYYKIKMRGKIMIEIGVMEKEEEEEEEKEGIMMIHKLRGLSTHYLWPTCPRERAEDNPNAPTTLPFLPIMEGMFLAGIIIPAGIFHNPKQKPPTTNHPQQYYYAKFNPLSFFLLSLYM